MNLPNKLTILRIVLVPLFVALLLIPAIPYNEIWAILVFSLSLPSPTCLMAGSPESTA